jgi:thiol-disulfide isomerase/thioredoxin
MKNVAYFAFVVVAVSVGLCEVARASDSIYPAPPPKSVAQSYAELFKGGWVIVFSDTSYCKPCRQYKPTLAELAKTHQVKVLRPRQHGELADYFDVNAVLEGP